ncbi:Catsper1 [Symbiodinium natans]|uniref:Catsper1 protein n=1 Tax=Symbiodinium natans TaxID=878477 RepID=A0A812VET5_9DINO|nr:Catsper1 [Symbiodinium natans]
MREKVEKYVLKATKALRPQVLPSAFQQLNAETKEVMERTAEHVANKGYFNAIIAVVLCVNTVVIGIETDYSRGRALEDRLPFFVLETLFTAIFIAEVLVRMHHLGWEYAIDPWNIFDYSLVVFSWTDMLVSVTEVESGGLRLAASLRLFRLLRVVRSIRGVKLLSGLWLVIQGLLDSYKTVLWIAFAMAIFIFCFGAALCVLGGQDRFAFEYWYLGHMYLGSVLRAMFTSLQVATFDDWADSIARPLFQVAPTAGPVLFLLIFVVSFGTLNILVAVMVERISVITADNRLRAEQSRKHMEAILLESVVEELHANDRDGSGDLSLKEFKKMIRIPSLIKKLGLLGIGIEEAESLFEIMDVNHSGCVTPEEFIAGLQKVKGAAKGQDMVQLICYAQRQVVRATQFVNRIRFLNVQVDGVQERLNVAGKALQVEGLEQIQTASRNDVVWGEAAQRQLVLHHLDVTRQNTYPVVDELERDN